MWTKQQETLLKEIYPRYTKAEVMRRFSGLSWGSITGKASRMGLYRPVSPEEGTSGGRTSESWKAHHVKMQEKYGLSQEPFPFRAIHEARLRGDFSDEASERGF